MSLLIFNLAFIRVWDQVDYSGVGVMVRRGHLWWPHRRGEQSGLPGPDTGLSDMVSLVLILVLFEAAILRCQNIPRLCSYVTRLQYRSVWSAERSEGFRRPEIRIRRDIRHDPGESVVGAISQFQDFPDRTWPPGTLVTASSVNGGVKVYRVAVEKGTA